MSLRRSRAPDSRPASKSEATRVLLAEDSDRDAELVLHELKRSGLKFESRRVQTEVDFRRALDDFRPHIVLSDFAMPGFGGVAALRICRESGIDIPFIFVSGTIGEEVAVEAMKAGADDYVMKTNLIRLGPTVVRVLREAGLRQGGRVTQAALLRAQTMAKLAHIVAGPGGSFESWSDTLPQMIGLDPAAMPKSTRDWLGLVHPEDRAGVRAKFIEANRTGMRVEFEYRLKRADGSWINITQTSEALAGPSLASGASRWFGTLQDVTEQKRAAERLQSSESLKSAIIDASLDCVVSIDHEGAIVEFNPAAESTFGIKREDAVGKPMVDVIIPPRLRDAHRRGFARYLATGEGTILGKRLELEALRADGSEFPVELAVTAIRSGSKLAFTAFIRDLTERKRAEEELRRFRLAMDSSADIILIIDRATMCHLDVNQTACRLLGYTREELMRMGPQDLLPLSRSELEEKYDELIANPSRTSGIRSSYRCKDGSQLPFESTRHVLRSGDRWLITVISRDIRERLLSESALRDSEERHRAVFEQAAVGIVHSSLDGRMLMNNARFAEIIGFSREEASALNIRDVTHPDDIDRSVEGRTRMLEGAGTPYERELRLVRKDGSRIWAQITTSLVRAAEGQPSYFVSVILDISERKRLQDEAQRAAEEQRRMRQLLDNIVDNIPTAVQLKSVAEGYRIVMWNKAAEAIYGLRREEAIGRTVHDVWLKPDADRYHSADLELVASGGMQDYPDRESQSKDRGPIHVHLRKVALFDGDGKATHVLVIADDITAQLADQTRLRESEARFRSLTSLSSDVYWEQDDQFRFTGLSGKGSTLVNSEVFPLIGKKRWESNYVNMTADAWAEHIALLQAHKSFRDMDLCRLGESGKKTWISISGEPVFDASGIFQGYRGVGKDITERKRDDERIGRLNRVYAVLSGINATIVRVDNREELFREACRISVEAGKFRAAWIGIVDSRTNTIGLAASQGLDDEYIRAMPVQQIAASDGVAPERIGLAPLAIMQRKPIIAADMTTDPRVTLRKSAQDRGFRSLAILPLIVSGEAVGVLALYASEIGFFDEDEMKLLLELAGDISFALDHIEKASRLDYLAYYDALTGLANRTLFQERLTQHIHAAKNSQHKIAVVVADIERFRMINDSLGRQAGDALLKQVAARLARVVDQTELARIGTDHFAIVLPEMKGRSEIGRMIEEIWHSCLDEPFALEDTEIRIALKGGISLFPSDGMSADALFRNAEAAWKNAKLKGERYLFHAQEMTARNAEKLTLENKLRQAIEKEQFVLHYQPKVDLETRGIVGVEALIRWQSPERGLVPPGLFIPLLEETGLILQVGAWALQRAVFDHSRWLKDGLKAPRIAVNVSQIQMRQRDFVDVVTKLVAQGANPTGIDLEITESLLMEDIAGNIKKLKAVSDLGLKIAIDDFGTGYSSLGYLARLPVHTLKIDRSFVMTMLNDPNTMTLVQTIISLAHSLRLAVVAEGVEQEDQAKMLRLLRCDEMQGYLFSKPLPIGEITAMLRASK
jgi:PAS domain S-box-containing protein/diguanylate cyclase (GGDEF)-like protein